MRRRHGWVLITVILLASGPQIGTARADDVQVNTFTTSNQRWPSVALGAGGDFVVVWDSDGSAGTDTWYFSIQGQRYASDGSTAEERRVGKACRSRWPPHH